MVCHDSAEPICTSSKLATLMPQKHHGLDISFKRPHKIAQGCTRYVSFQAFPLLTRKIYKMTVPQEVAIGNQWTLYKCESKLAWHVCGDCSHPCNFRLCSRNGHDSHSSWMSTSPMANHVGHGKFKNCVAKLSRVSCEAMTHSDMKIKRKCLPGTVAAVPGRLQFRFTGASLGARPIESCAHMCLPEAGIPNGHHPIPYEG